MLAIDPSRGTIEFKAPHVEEALLHVRNPNPSAGNCRRDPCPADEHAGYTDLALHAYMSAAIGMVYAMKDRQVERDADDMLTLHSLVELLANATLLVCQQRHGVRERVACRQGLRAVVAETLSGSPTS